jgi:hypothetical protein
MVSATVEENTNFPTPPKEKVKLTTIIIVMTAAM